MSRHSKAVQLLRALQRMLPDANFRVIHERPWHSLTFTGTQICLSALLVDTSAEHTQLFMHHLPDHEFDLSGQLVADIAVTETCFAAGQNSLVIDALLLDD